MSSRPIRLLNRALLFAIFGILACLVLVMLTRSPSVEQAPAPTPAAQVGQTPAATPRAPVEPFSGTLPIPVAGVTRAQLADTFTQARANGRSHDAIDIMAPRGTPILAAADGNVEKLHFSQGGGGISVYVRSPDRHWIYYYAHLEGYAPGLAEGQQVRRGALLGFVGSTGNANPEAPHLHFAINAMTPGERWWAGTPINPYPLLAGSGVHR